MDLAAPLPDTGPRGAPSPRDASTGVALIGVATSSAGLPGAAPLCGEPGAASFDGGSSGVVLFGPSEGPVPACTTASPLSPRARPGRVRLITSPVAPARRRAGEILGCDRCVERPRDSRTAQGRRVDAPELTSDVAASRVLDTVGDLMAAITFGSAVATRGRARAPVGDGAGSPTAQPVVSLGHRRYAGLMACSAQMAQAIHADAISHNGRAHCGKGDSAGAGHNPAQRPATGSATQRGARQRRDVDPPERGGTGPERVPDGGPHDRGVGHRDGVRDLG
ncbi:hypothetical protein CLV68_3685 [Actinokineospora cianjurensis]|uniref:Uncharacterized protein n=1 Tax=Actinokineospora cianjurensis TaxID=585224 RepID=A0A421B499_9PSEU|nr:hypothetical protein CLV68_3685 [Actinokineospora cianjurensis]